MNSSQLIKESLDMIDVNDKLKSYFDDAIAFQSWDTLIPNFKKAIEEGKLSIEEVVRLSILLGCFCEAKRRGV